MLFLSLVCLDVHEPNFNSPASTVKEISSGSQTFWGAPNQKARKPFPICSCSRWRRHLVNAYEVEAGIGVIAGNTV